jgi:uncharacterized protein with GYD domain
LLGAALWHTAIEEDAMPTYVLMTKLTPEITSHYQDRKEVGEKWKRAVEEKCPGIRWISHYYLLGPYDYMDIFEAPDEETAAKVSMITSALGAVKAETWTAIPYARFLELTQEV